MPLPASKLDPLFRDKVARARAMSPEARLRAGAELFEYTRAICVAGIRQQHPNATEAEVRDLFRQRLRIARELDHRA